MTPAEKTRLLAERVMGWDRRGGFWFNAAGGLVEDAADWDPLTNLSHAGEVMEAMISKGWTCIARNVAGMHMVGLASGERSVRCFAHTLSAAICHAALLAEGVKEEDL